MGFRWQRPGLRFKVNAAGAGSLIGLAARYAETVAARRFPGETSHDVKRHLLAIEERIREFFGVSGLRHSFDCESDAVVDYLLSWRDRR